MTDPIFTNVPRGVPTLAQSAFAPPLATFADPQHVQQSQTLRFDDNKLFLGVLGATMKQTTRRNGTIEHYAQGVMRSGWPMIAI